MENVSVLESSGFGLVGIDDDVVFFAVIVFDEAPFCAAGKSRAATAPEIRSLHGVYNFRRLHRDGLSERFIAAVRQICFDAGIVARLADILKDDAPLLRVRFRHDKGFPAHLYFSTMPETASGEILSCSSSLMSATGALPQLARHSTNSTLNFPSAVVGGALP